MAGTAPQPAQTNLRTLQARILLLTFFTWLPLYLVETKGFAMDVSAYASNGFEIGGFVGLVIGGFIADKYFSNNRGRLAWYAMIGVTIGLAAFRGMTHGGVWMVVLILIPVALRKEITKS